MVGALPAGRHPAQTGQPWPRRIGAIVKRVAARTAIVQALCASALLLLAQPAWSAPKVPNGDTFTIVLSSSPEADLPPVCDFPVSITITSAQPVAGRTTLPNGLIIVTGPAVATVTNLSTGESATFNISGPSLQNPETGEVTVFGTNLILGPAGLSGTDTSGEDIMFLIFTSGRLSFTFLQPLDEPLRGTVTQDVCTQLA